MNMAILQPKRQINLLNAALIPTTDVFTARRIVVGVGLTILTMAFIGWWAMSEQQKLARELASKAAARVVEASRLVPTAGDGPPNSQQLASREQDLRAQNAALVARRAVRDTLRRGLADIKHGPSALMRLMVTTAPPAAWVTDLRVAGGQFELIGKTLDPAAINLWQERLIASGVLAEKPMPAVRVERIETPAPTPGRPSAVYSFAITAALTIPLADDGGRP